MVGIFLRRHAWILPVFIRNNPIIAGVYVKNIQQGQMFCGRLNIQGGCIYTGENRSVAPEAEKYHARPESTPALSAEPALS